MRAAGRLVSIVNIRLAGAPAFPAASKARTWNVWLPSASGAPGRNSPGPVQGPNAPLPTRHAKRTPLSTALNVKVGRWLRVKDDGPERLVAAAGGVVSTVTAIGALGPVRPS